MTAVEEIIAAALRGEEFPTRRRRGELHWNHKLNEEQVREIRSSKLSNREQARLLDISPANVQAIRSRRSWKHVTP